MWKGVLHVNRADIQNVVDNQTIIIYILSHVYNIQLIHLYIYTQIEYN